MTAVVAWKAVTWFVGRAGVILFKGNRKYVTGLVATFGGVAVSGYYIKEKLTDAAEDLKEELTTPLLAAGAGIGIILLLVLFTRR